MSDVSTAQDESGNLEILPQSQPTSTQERLSPSLDSTPPTKPSNNKPHSKRAGEEFFAVEKQADDNSHTITPYIDPNNDVKLFLTYRSLYLSTHIAISDPTMNPIVSVPISAWKNFQFHILRNKEAKTIFHRLEDANGYAAPGESTLILGQPGSGRSSLLKLLGQQLSQTKGDILFNSLTRRELEDETKAVDMKKMVSYVDQLDNHFPQLTVWETLQFVHGLSTPQPSDSYLELLLSQFGLEECRNTPVGACSGGQKRRISLLVGLANPSTRFVAFDQYSDGLDSAVAERITKFMTEWAIKNNTHFIATLQQPSPAMFNMFTNIILLHEGRTVYSGPQKDILMFFQGMGYTCPQDVDVPTFLLHIITHPKAFLLEQAMLEGNLTQIEAFTDPNFTDNFSTPSSRTSSVIRLDPKRVKSLPTSFGPLTPSTVPIIDVDEMCHYYTTSPFYKHIQHILHTVEQTRIQDTSKLNNKCTPAMKEISSNLIVQQFKDFPLHPITPQTINPVVTPATKKRYHPGYNSSVFQLFSVVLYRQLILASREMSLHITRLIPCIIIGFVFGGLYWNLRIDDFHYRAASYIDVLTEVAYSNLIELGLFIWCRQLIHSQLHLYPTWTYTLSVFTANIPLSLIIAMVLTVIPYSMIGHSPQGIAMVTYFLLLWIHSIVFSTLFRFFASLSTNVGMAYALTSPIISVFSLCSGFYVRLPNLPYYFWWIYYISPFTYGLRSLATTEFLSSRYDHLIPDPDNPAVLVRAGDIYLELNGMSPDGIWILGAVLFCIGVVIILIIGTSYFLYSPEVEYSIGTRRFAGHEDDDTITFDLQEEQQHFIEQDRDEVELAQHQIQAQHELDQRMSPDAKTHSPSQHPQPVIEMTTFETIPEPSAVESSNYYEASTTANNHEPSRSRVAGGNRRLQTLTEELPFAPASLTFENIRFTVKALDDQGNQFDRILLQNVTGFCRSGQSLALMGSSGAGKTTLLNTLFGMNPTTASQTMEGTILVNGQPLTRSQFSSITGYCEQFDRLFPFETVYETLFLSAKMRLGEVPDEIVHKVVEEVIDVLELSQARDLLIGSPTAPVLSPSQKKRVSIGIELAANPAILFLDEPTTGLDSESAIAVVRVINKIARSGRCVITTIHQPSAQLLYMFDSLLLLGSGGYTTYFGRLGRRARKMIQYFNKIPSITPCPPRVNPSEWLIEQVSLQLSQSIYTQAEKLYNDYYSGKLPNNKPVGFDETVPPKFQPFSELSPTKQFIRFLYLHFLTSEVRANGLKAFELIVTDGGSEKKDDFAPTSLVGFDGDLADTTKLSYFSQFRYVFVRTWHVYTRSSSLLFTRLCATFLLSSFFALFYLGLDVDSPASIITFLAATVIAIGNTCYMMATTALPLYSQLRPIFYRETFANYYSSAFWPLSFTLCEALWVIPWSLTGFVPHYFAIDATARTPIGFFSFWLVVYVLCFFFTQFSMMLSLALPSNISEIVQNMYVSLCFSFGNIASNWPTINRGFQIIMWLFPFYFINGAITTQQFADKDNVMIDVVRNNVLETMSAKKYVLELTGYVGSKVYGWSMLWLMVMVCAFWTIGYFGAIFFRFKR